MDSLATFLPHTQPAQPLAQPEAEPEVASAEVTEAWSSLGALRNAARPARHGDRNELRPGLQGLQRPNGRNLPGVVAACELEMDLVDV